MTLATVLIAAGRAGERLRVAEVCDQLQLTPQELREDVAVLNVVNFGGGAYVIYAEVLPNGEIEVDPEPYSDTFDRPARLLPIEAKALVAAIDLIGLAAGRPAVGAREGRRRARLRPGRGGAAHRLARTSTTTSCTRSSWPCTRRGCSSSSTGRSPTDRYSERDVEPYALINSIEGWYVAAWDRDARPARGTSGWTGSSTRRRKMERFEPREGLNPAADIGGWPRTGRIGGSRAARVKV